MTCSAANTPSSFAEPQAAQGATTTADAASPSPAAKITLRTAGHDAPNNAHHHEISRHQTPNIRHEAACATHKKKHNAKNKRAIEPHRNAQNSFNFHHSLAKESSEGIYVPKQIKKQAFNLPNFTLHHQSSRRFPYLLPSSFLDFVLVASLTQRKTVTLEYCFFARDKVGVHILPSVLTSSAFSGAFNSRTSSEKGSTMALKPPGSNCCPSTTTSSCGSKATILHNGDNDGGGGKGGDKQFST